MPDTNTMPPLEPGPLVRIGDGPVLLDVAPHAGGRIAQIVCEGIEQLVGPDDGDLAMNMWGCFPMVPWAGRLRHGSFDFDGHEYRLPLNLGGHALHGVGFSLPWQLDAHSRTQVELSLALPRDERWPFGGMCRQRIELAGRRLHMTLEVIAGALAMPAVIGWHPWFRKPERIEFHPDGMYPRDSDGIAMPPLAPPVQGPWDDCFANHRPVVVHRGGQALRLASDCAHWVVYDEPAHASCIEPQTGLPDAFNATPHVLAPGRSLGAWLTWEWSDGSQGAIHG